MKKILALVFITTVLMSCKKDKDLTPEPPPTITYPNYSQLKTGNYWVYQIFFVDTLGNETPTNQFDSCYVEKDTLINGNLYYKMIRPEFSSPLMSTFFWRDSLHYIVDSAGIVFFSSQDFNSVFFSRYVLASGDTVCYYERKMSDNNFEITNAAGTFSTINSKETYYMYPNWSYNGNPRYRNRRFAKDMGIVEETLLFFVGDPKYRVRKLVNYNVN